MSLALIMVVALLVGAGVYTVAMSQSESPTGTTTKYIAHVTDQKLSQTTSYNIADVVKDGALIAIASVAGGACSAETFGACAAAVPAFSSLLSGAMDDPIISVNGAFNFTDTGNGTATDVDFTVAVYVDGQLTNTTVHQIPTLAAGTAVLEQYVYSIEFKDLPTAIWSDIQGKGNINIEVVNLSYQGGA
jgi:hypothetical protein